MHPRLRLSLLTAAVAVVSLVAGCTAAGPTATAKPPATRSAQPAPTPTGPPVAFTWTAVNRQVAGGFPLQIAHADAGKIVMLWMNAAELNFRFIPGTKYPEFSPVRSVDVHPSSWVPTMLAAFNGGFKMSDHAGGYAYNGKVITALKNGYASLINGRDGSVQVKVWQQGMPVTPTLAIRQNLKPLIANGVLHASAADAPNRWGKSLRNAQHADRTALGELPNGNLIFITGNHVTAYDLGLELQHAGAVTAMILDMNHTWPTGYVYDAPVGRHDPVGHKILAETYYPPSLYYTRYKKDFIVVSARASSTTALSAPNAPAPSAVTSSGSNVG